MWVPFVPFVFATFFCFAFKNSCSKFTILISFTHGCALSISCVSQMFDIKERRTISHVHKHRPLDFIPCTLSDFPRALLAPWFTSSSQASIEFLIPELCPTECLAQTPVTILKNGRFFASSPLSVLPFVVAGVFWEKGNWANNDIPDNPSDFHANNIVWWYS